MNTIRLFEWIDQHRRVIKILMAPLLVIFVGAVYIFVYMTGGIKFVYSHSMYLPILLSGFVFGVKGGVLIGVIGGVVLGPFMPIDVISGEMQKTTNWLYRTGFFALIGILSGTASDNARSYIAHLKWVSRHDPSTQLPNRRALFERLSEIAGEKRTSQSLILSVISLENIMELKSAFGFTVIEEAIRQLVKRLENSQNEKRIYRTDTRQIAVLITRADQETEKLLDDLAEASKEPIFYNGIPIHLDTRMGTVEFSHVAEQSEDYLQKAEAALAVAQEKDQDSLIYSPEIMTVTEENLAILGALKDAIEKGQLSLHYQPKIFIPTGAVHGVEALMRWNHPVWGNIPPEEFILRTEHSTLVQMITEFALDQAMGQVVRWEQYDINVPVAVNISTRNLLQPGFTDLILRLLDRYGLRGELLELEVTEGALMVDMERSIHELVKLAGLQIIISIDDFGTGYSSLQYLHKLPISFVKIDQSFIRRLPADKDAISVLEAAVMLAHKMGIKAIAEGVETKEVYDFLSNIGCDLAQGFLISRPLSAANFAKWYIQCSGKYLQT
jgi:EAL domain-containing protein (putative c-di-GMP-specific phosphodiesterase class I)/GGDEF domain-containing protein